MEKKHTKLFDFSDDCSCGYTVCKCIYIYICLYFDLLSSSIHRQRDRDREIEKWKKDPTKKSQRNRMQISNDYNEYADADNECERQISEYVKLLLKCNHNPDERSNTHTHWHREKERTARIKEMLRHGNEMNRIEVEWKTHTKEYTHETRWQKSTERQG